MKQLPKNSIVYALVIVLIIAFAYIGYGAYEDKLEETYNNGIQDGANLLIENILQTIQTQDFYTLTFQDGNETRSIGCGEIQQ